LRADWDGVIPMTRPSRAAAQARPAAASTQVTPAERSASAQAKATRQHDQNGRPYLSYRGLLAHLGTLTRNELRFAGAPAAVPVLTQPTSRQKEAFDLIAAAIPLTLRK
jgi:hypothetical protein